jgi:hypothetical protein
MLPTLAAALSGVTDRGRYGDDWALRREWFSVS